MIRFIIINALLFLVPFALYIAYIYLSLGRDAIQNQLSLKALGWLSVIGIAITTTTIIILTNYTGQSVDKVYKPARYIDGQLVPGRFVTPEDN